MTITLPGWMNVQEWTTTNWLAAAAIIQVVYGLITHQHSMAQVRKWNRVNRVNTDNKEVDFHDCITFFFPRMLISIPWRITCFIAGICVIATVPIFRLLLGLKPLNRNVKDAISDCFGAAMTWHLPPEDLWGIWRGRN